MSAAVRFGRAGGGAASMLCGQDVPFGTDILLKARGYRRFHVHMEICEDVWTPMPPSSFAALAGATVLLNLSASNVTIGKSDWRRLHCARPIPAAASRPMPIPPPAGRIHHRSRLGRAGDDLREWALLAEAERFAAEPQLILADVDLERLVMDRIRQNTSATCRCACATGPNFRTVLSSWTRPFRRSRASARPVERFPFVPSDDAQAERALLRGLQHPVAWPAQAAGERPGREDRHRRLRRAGFHPGADRRRQPSTRSGCRAANILAYTLPGFATSKGTKANAWR
jgi:NAD+ synthase (glutamine-hydrolysing)